MHCPDRPRVALLTLGCARNEVDSEELAARLHADGWQVTTDGEGADVVLVNTCGFVEKAKQDSIETLLAAADTGAKVVAAGCMAERYGTELADSLPEAAGGAGLRRLPRHRRPARRGARRRDDRRAHPARPPRAAAADPGRPPRRRAWSCPGTASIVDEHTPAHLRTVLRRRLDTGPVASLKLASGCDRRCAFCAIPAFRGAFVSRTPDELLAEAEWLAGTGVRELVLVSENSTSYGKDLGDPRALEKLLPQLAAVDRHRPGAGVSYLQPAETRPGLVEAIATTPGRRALLRPVVPALQRAGAAPDAAVRLHRAVPGAARLAPARWPRRPAPAATSSSASPARPGPTSTSWSGS